MAWAYRIGLTEIMSHHHYLPRYMPRILLSIFLTSLFVVSVTGQERPPNIILILVDDMGWMDLSC